MALEIRIGDASVIALNTTLKLRYKRIGDKGATVLAGFSETPSGIALNTTYLDLKGNYVGNEGAKALALNTTLTYLNFKINNYHVERALSEMVERRNRDVFKDVSLYRSAFLACSSLVFDERVPVDIQNHARK